MVSLPRERTATYADLEALPEEQKAELIDGALYLMSGPRGRHIRVTSILTVLLGARFGLSDSPSSDGPGGWWILVEPEVHLRLDRRVVRPDLAGWRRERMPKPPTDSHKFTLVPDWICEVLSPSTASRDMLVKMPCYLEAGVQWAWIVHPQDRRVDVFRASDDRDRREWIEVGGYEGDAVAAIAPFDAAPIDLAPCW